MEINEFKTQLEGVQAATMEAIKTAKDELNKRYDEAKAAGANAADLKLEMERAIKRLDAVEGAMSRGNAYMDEAIKSIGEQFIADENIKNFASKPGHKGSSAMKLKSFMEFPEFHPGVKATITSAAVGSSTPGILVPQRIPGIVRPGVQRIRVRDLMPRFTTDNNAVEFVKENAFTNTASPVAETVSKPESSLTFTIDSVTVKTLAHWVPLAKQVMADLPVLQSYVNQRLLEGLKDVEDAELVSGDGTGQHLSGLVTEATAYATARNQASDTLIDKINHMISQIEDVLHAADGIIMHPAKWRQIQLLKTEEGGTNKGSYLLGGPAGDAMPMLWGLPVATTTACPFASVFVGAFQPYTAVWDRMAAQVALSTEHADYFVKNMVAILAEERLAFTVTRSDAVVYAAAL